MKKLAPKAQILFRVDRRQAFDLVRRQGCAAMLDAPDFLGSDSGLVVSLRRLFPGMRIGSCQHYLYKKFAFKGTLRTAVIQREIRSADVCTTNSKLVLSPDHFGGVYE